MLGKLLAVLALMGLVGCRDSTGVLTRAMFEVDAREYVQGQLLTAHVTNGTDSGLGVNTCFTSLERLNDGHWTTITDAFGLPPDAACVASLFVLDPGVSMPYQGTVPVDLAPGAYRLATNGELQPNGPNVAMRTSAFVVRAR